MPVFSIATNIFFKGSKFTFISFLILVSMVITNVKAIAIIAEGDRGQNVTILQQQLSQLGYFQDDITGYFGKSTTKAVVIFQQRENITIDGVVGIETQAVLDEKTNIQSLPTALRQGDSGADVIMLQERLKELGFFQGKITGFFGSLTQQAVINFQKSENLPVDGTAGRETLIRLNLRNAPTENETSQNTSENESDIENNNNSTVNNSNNNNSSTSTDVIKRGDSGEDVQWVQEKLKIAGFFQTNVTGFFGPLTEIAVKEFQQSQNINADGVVGINTRNALAKITSNNSSSDTNNNSNSTNNSSSNNTNTTPPTTILRKGNSGSGVRWLQERLKTLGFFNHAITGNFGSITQNAVRRFQQSRNLAVDGIVGMNTRNALLKNNSQQNSSSSSSNIPTTVIKKGDSGAEVRWLQEKLTTLGFFNHKITDYFGSITESALKKFQESRNLKVDGIAGAKTLAALADNSSNNSTNSNNAPTINNEESILKRGSSGEKVKLIQEQLRELGTYKGPITGFFGPLTEIGVKEFQRLNNLTPDGIVGKNTQVAINNAMARI